VHKSPEPNSAAQFDSVESLFLHTDLIERERECVCVCVENVRKEEDQEASSTATYHQMGNDLTFFQGCNTSKFPRTREAFFEPFQDCRALLLLGSMSRLKENKKQPDGNVRRPQNDKEKEVQEKKYNQGCRGPS
jgi:hypothetical protein